MKEADTDGNGELNFEEWLNLMGYTQTLSREEFAEYKQVSVD